MFGASSVVASVLRPSVLKASRVVRQRDPRDHGAVFDVSCGTGVLLDDVERRKTRLVLTRPLADHRQPTDIDQDVPGFVEPGVDVADEQVAQAGSDPTVDDSGHSHGP